MSNVAISDLPVATVINATDIIPFVQPAVAGTTKTITKTLLFTSPTMVTPVLGAATATSLAVSGVSTLTGGAVIQGLTVGLGAGAISTNSAFGVTALSANIFGSQNVAVGYRAMLTNQTGDTNVAVGESALNTNLSGAGNTSVGYQTLFTNSSGGYNTALGWAALSSSLGSSNVAIGTYAGAFETGSNAFYVNNQNRLNTAGDKTKSLMYGVFDALVANQSLAVNAALAVTGATTVSTTLSVTGVSTLTGGAVVQGMTVGLGTGAIASNTAVGTSALLGVIGGGFNTAIGFGTLLSVAGGSGNVGVGYAAGGNINAGVSNTALGNSSLINCSGGSYNTSLGSSTGATTGSNNTYVGYDSGSLSNSNSNNSYFGSFTGVYGAVDLRPNDSHIVLATGNGAPKQIIDSSGNAQFITGAVVVYTPAPASISAVATLTNANLQAQIINTTGTSYTVTMPLGSTLDTLIVWATTDIGFEFSVINTASGTITMAANTGVTTLGGLTIATGSSAKFRIRRTAASTYVMYRIS